MPKFNEAELPENIDFFNWYNVGQSLLMNPPGVSSNFVLIRGSSTDVVFGQAFRPWGELYKIDCAAVNALDKARTSDLLALRERLALMLTAEDSHELHAPAPGCSSLALP